MEWGLKYEPVDAIRVCSGIDNVRVKPEARFWNVSLLYYWASLATRSVGEKVASAYETSKCNHRYDWNAAAIVKALHVKNLQFDSMKCILASPSHLPSTFSLWRFSNSSEVSCKAWALGQSLLCTVAVSRTRETGKVYR